MAKTQSLLAAEVAVVVEFVIFLLVVVVSGLVAVSAARSVQ